MSADQLGLWDRPEPRLAMPAPRSRATDSATSTRAAAKHAGTLKGQAAVVLKLITDYPGHTAWELAQKIGTTETEHVRWRYAINRRAADLATKYFVRKGSLRECTVTKNDQITWYAT